jgi:sugar phosphate isomerase/epimerase
LRRGLGSFALAWNIGVPGFPCPRPLQHRHLIDLAAENDLDAVQFADNLPVDALPAEEIDRLQAYGQDRGIAIEVGTRGIGISKLTRLAILAARFQTDFVRLVIDEGEDQPTPEEAVSRLKPLEPIFAGAGVKLAIENHDRFPAKVLRDMVEKLGPDWCGICLDTANSLGCLEGTREVVEALAPLTVNLHAKDIEIRRISGNMGFTVEGTALGEGQIDWQWVLSQVRPTARSVTIEHWPALPANGVPPFDAERSMAVRSAHALRNLLEVSHP